MGKVFTGSWGDGSGGKPLRPSPSNARLPLTRQAVQLSPHQRGKPCAAGPRLLGNYRMTKKHFIELANVIRMEQGGPNEFSEGQLRILARFCKSQNGNFNAPRWVSYIAGECGPCGGAVKQTAKENS